MTPAVSTTQSQLLTIRGRLSSAAFLPWVERHSRRLGLTCTVVRAGAQEAVFRVGGQADLIDALEVGCLLGPIDAWVDTITRRSDAFPE